MAVSHSVRAADAPVKLTQDATSIKVEVGGQHFTTYIFAPGTDANFHRPYCYPVMASDGKAMTSDQTVTNPKEHPHHRSVWVSHGAVNGVDHWAHKGAKQKHVKFDKVEGDTIVDQIVWGGKTDADPDLLKETRTLRFFALEDGARGIDLTVALTPAGNEAVTLADTKEAGLAAVRVHPQMGNSAKGDAKKAAALVTATGATGEKAVWGKSANWCDASGQIDGKPYGVAIFDHPSNPRHPTCWHTREYGLHAANCFGLHDFDKTQPKGAGDLKIEPGKTVTFKYRILFHTGDAKAAGLEAKYKAWTAN